MSVRKRVDPGVSVDSLWQEGRRIYATCGYRSQLNTDLRAIGAKWDAGRRALWVGSTKRAAVIEAVRQATDRRAAIDQTKALGLWLAIPYEAEGVRLAAKTARAVFDGERKAWAFRDQESLARVTELRDRWITEQDEAERLARVERDRAAQEYRDAEQVREAEARVARGQRVLVDSGRTPTGEQIEHREVSTSRLTKPVALEKARPLGSLVVLRDGRRGIVTGVEVWFTNSEMASSTCWHPQTHDLAHWDFSYQVAIVEPTAEESAGDAAAEAALTDARELADLVTEAAKRANPVAVDHHATITDPLGVITVTTGIAAVIHAGQLTLTPDVLVWQHPGYYDDYVPTEGSTADSDLIERMRAVLAAGERKRVLPGQMPTEYRVTRG